jgi:hypothetical protein
MKQLRVSILALFFALSLIASGSNEAKACSGSTNLRALQMCYDGCRELYPGDNILDSTLRDACFTGCTIGCIIYGTN